MFSAPDCKSCFQNHESTYKGHRESVDQLCWHPSNPDLFVTASGDKTIRIWDARGERLYYSSSMFTQGLWDKFLQYVRGPNTDQKQEGSWGMLPREFGSPEFNPFTPESDQCQISPAASQEILHHTVRRTWLFIAYSDEKWLYYKFSLHHSYNRFLKGWENTLFELRSERVKYT